MRSPRLDADQRRRAIVEAVTPLFARKGFSGTTTKELAEAAGVSEALLYRHFPSKEAMYREILLRDAQEGTPVFRMMQSLEPSTSTLIHMVHRIVQWFLLEQSPERKNRLRLVINSLLEDGTFARMVFETAAGGAFKVFEASWKSALDAGHLVPGTVTSQSGFWFVHHLPAMLAILCLPPRSTEPTGTPPDELVAQATVFLLRGLGLRNEIIIEHYNPKALALLAIA